MRRSKYMKKKKLKNLIDDKTVFLYTNFCTLISVHKYLWKQLKLIKIIITKKREKCAKNINKNKFSSWLHIKKIRPEDLLVNYNFKKTKM